MVIDIGSKSDKPIGKELSNFTNWGFTFDGIECQSIESVLQSLKFPDPEEQKKICKMLGYLAKYKGMKSKWNDPKKSKRFRLYWKGKEYHRISIEFQELLDRIFTTVYTEVEEAKELLIATGDHQLTHTMGKHDPTETVLTEEEFCERLMKIREELKKGE